jgi:GNAT superfamily N-acetyltransferase
VTVDPLVRSADPDDVEALVVLVDEMDRFYGSEPAGSLDERREEVRTALFGPEPWAHALVALGEGSVVGVATYSYHWPAVGLTRSLFLKELYVAEGSRRSGIGSALMRRLVALAAEQGCSRVEWMTDRPNVFAQDFYRTIGHGPDGSKLVYRIEVG